MAAEEVLLVEMTTGSFHEPPRNLIDKPRFLVLPQQEFKWEIRFLFNVLLVPS